MVKNKKEEFKFEYDLYEDEGIDYDRDIVIDEFNLHEEWVRHGETVKKYIRYYHKAKKLMDEAYKRFKYTKARLDHEIRKDPSKFDLVKATEPEIKEAVLYNDDYQKAEQEYLDAKYESEMAGDVLEDMRDKKYRMQELGKLVNIGYFVDPDVPKQFGSSAGKKVIEEAKDKQMAQSVMESYNEQKESNESGKPKKQIKSKKDGKKQ